MKGPVPWSQDTLRGLGTEPLDLYVYAVEEDDVRRARSPVLHNSDGDLVVMWRGAHDRFAMLGSVKAKQLYRGTAR